MAQVTFTTMDRVTENEKSGLYPTSARNDEHQSSSRDDNEIVMLPSAPPLDETSHVALHTESPPEYIPSTLPLPCPVPAAIPETIFLNVGDEPQPPPYHSDPPPPYSPAIIKHTIKLAKEESNGNVDFARRVVFGVCCGAVCCGIVIALNLAIPITMVAIGSMYLYDCPRQRYIPIYLIVGGCFGVTKAIVNIIDQVRAAVARKKAGGDAGDVPKRRPNPIDGMLSCFLGTWFIAGCYWIYSIHDEYQWTEPEASNYCHQTLYLFAFWLTSLSFILLGVACCCCCALAITTCVIGKSS